MKQVINRLPLITRPDFLQSSIALRKVTSKSGMGVYASSDMLFKGAIFGRDSLEVAEDLITVKPKLTRQILLTLASLQGQTKNDTNEEEPGKIIHEYRTSKVDGQNLDSVSLHIFQELASKWGGNDHELAYYGSIDSTPQFVRTVGHYCNYHGTQFLNKSVQLRDGQFITMGQALALSTDWLVDKLNESKSGLLEYQAKNPRGIENQTWKDSYEFYIHKNGQIVNHNMPVASIEVQGLAYDALKEAAMLLPTRVNLLNSAANNLRDRTIELLWRPMQHYFALGIDYASDGSIRPIETITANPAALLDTSFFDELNNAHKQLYVSGLARNIMGTDFLTDAGVRSRSLSEKDLVKFWDYHGSFTSWPKETYDIAKGLRRQGLSLLSEELENRLLNITRKSRTYPEFVYVDYRGRVITKTTKADSKGNILLDVDSTNHPEAIQAWTVSAALAISAYRATGSKPVLHQQLWRQKLETEILRHIPHMPELKTLKELNARYPNYAYRLDARKSRVASSNITFASE